MKSYKLDIKWIVAAVGILSLLIFSALLTIFNIANLHNLGEILLHYGLIIAPISVLWILLDKYLWHTKLFQMAKKSMNIPPDLRGRWEGMLENADGSPPQKFAIEVRQTLTTIHVHSYSPIAHSASILCEIATSSQEEIFTLCYLWQGTIHQTIKDLHQGENFYGYTMLDFNTYDSSRVLKGSYFTNRKGAQTRGGIMLTWVSMKLKHRIE